MSISIPEELPDSPGRPRKLAPGRVERQFDALRMRGGLWAAVIVSRLVVLAAGAASALFLHRTHGWATLLDPQRLSSRLGSVGNVLAASAFRWDAIHYVTIAQHGYTSADATVFFPLYPLIIGAVAPAVGSPVIAGVLVSLIAFVVGLALVHRIAGEELGRRVADATVLLLAFSPLSFVFSAVYSESLLLALTAATFHLARRGRFVAACIAAAFATLTHIQGVVLVAPLALMYWKRRGRPRDLRRLWSPPALALMLPPLALADFFAFTDSRGWGWLAPITNQSTATYGRQLVGPLVTVFDSIRDVVTGLGSHETVPAGHVLIPEVQNLIYLGVLVAFVLALIAGWHRLPGEYTLFGALVLVLCTSSAVAVEPLQGFDRYMLPIFPLWTGAAAWLAERRLLRLALPISTGLLIILTIEFARWNVAF